MLISGIDVRLFALIPGETAAIPIAEASHINISLFRDKKPVRALSYVEERGRTRGQRTCAGSLIFTVLYGKALSELFERLNTTPVANENLIYLLLDQLPPLTIVGVAATEDPSAKKFTFSLIDLEFLSENTSMGISDLVVENATQFTAKYYFPLENVEDFDTLSQNLAKNDGTTFTDIISDAKYQKALSSVKNIGL